MSSSEQDIMSGKTIGGKQDGDNVRKKKRKHKEYNGTNVEATESTEVSSKEERRERKRLKKERKEKEHDQLQGTHKPMANAVPKVNTEEDEKEEALRKAARKAAKAAKKAGRRAESKGLSAEVHSDIKDLATLDEVHSDYKEHVSLSKLPQSEVDEFLAKKFITISHAGDMHHLRPIMDFTQLPQSALMQSSVFATFKNPTPIQSASWPFILSGRDVVGVAETGSGKTLAFGVPCVRHIASLSGGSGKALQGAARAVIVSPTRELAAQIHEQIERLARLAGLEAVCVYGGVPKDSQRKGLQTAQIVVATPGRLNDLIDEGSADLSNVSYVVLDEADRMLDKGFEQEIKKIISSTLPKSVPQAGLGSDRRRQTLMFTATWPQSVRELAATFMVKPVRINIGEDNPTGELRANMRITQTVEVVDQRAKEQRMLQLIKQYQSGKNSRDRILVFCLYKKEAQRVENFIRQRGFQVAGIHGDLSQDRRTKSLESFKSGETPLLVATDVAARGLDIPNVKVVLNVTFPLTVEDYVHRIGRTGRAGAEGLAITLFTEQDKAQSGALINVLKAANQPVPESLMKFGTTVKKKQHDAYGAFFKEDTGKKAEKIKFDD